MKYMPISTPPPLAVPGVAGHSHPFHDRTIVVTHCGRICLGRKKINFSTVFAGQAVGIEKFTTTFGWWLL